MKRRNYKVYTPEITGSFILYHVECETEYWMAHEIMAESARRCDLKDWDDLPVVDVEGIWEFYKLIGYDYRKKKYGLADSN